MPDALAAASDTEEDVVTSDVPGGRRVSGVSGALTVSVTTRPDAGRFVIVSVVGGCQDIPSDEQDDWPNRDFDDLT